MASPTILIVGGGPAGSSCARDLVRAGREVLVADRARFPRDKACAGWITPAVVRALGIDLEDYARCRTLQLFRGFQTSTIGRTPIDTDYGETVSYGIRRCEFDQYLLQRSGVRVLDGVSVNAIERRDGRWIVNGEIAADVLVGAGGHFCPVARWLNPGKMAGPLVAAQEIEFQLEAGGAPRCPVAPELPALFFCADRKGYGWSVRKGDYLNVGFGRLVDEGGGLLDEVRAFKRFLEARGLVTTDVPDRWKRHAYRLYARPQRRIAAEGVLLVGDAAGLAYPVSGEGILTAVESGVLAARALVDAGTDAGRSAFPAYERMLIERYGAPRPLREEPWRLPPALVSWLGVRLMSTHWFARRVLLDRWFLHRDESLLEITAAGG